MIQGLRQILAVLGYLAAVGVVALLAIVSMTIVVGVAVAVGSLPMLWLCPDVRQFFALVTGGRTTDARLPWRLVTRPRYLGLSVGFGLTYLCVAILLFGPIETLGLTGATLGPVPVLVAIPVAFVLLVVPMATLAHRASSAWTEGTAPRSAVLQWTAFLSVLVATGTAAPFLLLALWQ